MVPLTHLHTLPDLPSGKNLADYTASVLGAPRFVSSGSFRSSQNHKPRADFSEGEVYILPRKRIAKESQKSRKFVFVEGFKESLRNR